MILSLDLMKLVVILLCVYISQDLNICVKFQYVVVQVMRRYWILVSGCWIFSLTPARRAVPVCQAALPKLRRSREGGSLVLRVGRQAGSSQSS